MRTAKKIIEATAEIYEVSARDILGRRRTKDIAEARQVVAYLLRELSHLSFPQIGEELSGRDHTTALYAYGKIAEDLKTHQLLRQRVDIIIERLSSSGFKKSPPKKSGTKSRRKKPETSDQLSNYFQDLNLTPREESILDRYRKGLTLEEISKQFQITRERVRQIVQKAMLKELAGKVDDGYTINIEEYIKAEKEAHAIARNKVPEDFRGQILRRLKDIESGRISIRELAKEYQIPEAKLYQLPELAALLEEKTNARKKRWSRFYIKCRKCGTTVIPHASKGLCEDCLGIWRDPGRREDVILKLGSKCLNCGIERGEAIRKFGRDLYVSKNWRNNSSSALLCRGCFLMFTGEKLGKSKHPRRRSS